MKKVNLSNTIKDIWEPEKAGESVRGFYLERVKFPNSKFDKPAYLIGYPDGTCIAVNGDTVTQRNLDKLEPASNTFVSITYKGKQQGKKYEYRDYDFGAWILDAEEVEDWKVNVDIGVEVPSDSEQSSDVSGDNDDELPF